MTEAELDEVALGSIQRLIAGKGAGEIIAIRDELRQGLQSALQGLSIETVGGLHRQKGEDGCIAIRNHIMQRRLEVAYLNNILGDS